MLEACLLCCPHNFRPMTVVNGNPFSEKKKIFPPGMRHLGPEEIVSQALNRLRRTNLGRGKLSQTLLAWS